ncbi:hypothetical protein RHEC894_CH01750 [Rhizobium sp. CIAT894]|nr:hypothetical protein RHEC894_CH01750 [Rhizobium sp. CIAT894]
MLAPSPHDRGAKFLSGGTLSSCSQSRFRIVTGVSSGDVFPVSCGDGGCKR